MLNKVAPGQPITAELWNALVDEIRARTVSVDNTMRCVRSSGGTLLGALGAQFDFVEFYNDCQAGQTDRQVKRLTRDYSASSAPADQWKTAETLAVTMDPLTSLYLAGERHLAYFVPNAGQRVPIPGTQWHLGKAASPIVPEGSGSVTIFKYDGSGHSTTGLAVTAYDYAGYGVQQSPATCLVFQHQQSRRWYAINLCGASWGRAQSAWSENGGNPIVSVKTVGYWGDTTTYGSAFNVLLPRFNFGSSSTYTSRDPNVQSGDWIRFTRDAWNPADQPGLVCVSPYLDDKLGTIKGWYKTAANAAVPGGWQICDGTNGTPDLRSKFIRGVPSGGTMGTTGGGTSHTHANHASHSHTVEQTGGVQLTPTGTILDGSTGSTQYVFPNGNAVFTDTHAAFTHDTVNHEPPYHDVYWIIRNT